MRRFDPLWVSFRQSYSMRSPIKTGAVFPTCRKSCQLCISIKMGATDLDQGERRTRPSGPVAAAPSLALFGFTVWTSSGFRVMY